MLGRFLQPDAMERILAMELDPLVKSHAVEVLAKGYTVVRGAIPPAMCHETIAAFRRFEAANAEIFRANRNAFGHYPRIVNLHCVLPALLPLFTRNPVWLAVQDVLFGAPTALYTSLFYEVGSQQPLHRDTPVFATRPEYLYFGTTVYLEPTDDDNGCLEVMQGGHLMPELDREALARRRYGTLEAIPKLDGDAWEEYQNTVVEQGKARRLPVRKLHVQAGDSLIWHPQLPHGGTAIRDPRRTRMSLVMHTTPVGVPVYHQDAFFAPSRHLPERAAWDYRTVDGRQIVDNRHGVSFGHERAYALADFRAPDREDAAAARPPPLVAHGSLERLGPTGASGWAWAAEAPELRIPVEIRLHGKPIARCVADQPREDLVRAGIGDGAHAFAVAFAPPVDAGEVAALQITLVGCVGALGRFPDSGVRGSLDGVYPERVRGWVHDGGGTGAARFVVTCGEAVLATGRAHAMRPDVPQPDKPPVPVGFDVAFLPEVSPDLPAALRLWVVRGEQRLLACARDIAAFDMA